MPAVEQPFVISIKNLILTKLRDNYDTSQIYLSKHPNPFSRDLVNGISTVVFRGSPHLSILNKAKNLDFGMICSLKFSVTSNLKRTIILPIVDSKIPFVE
jgi:hypothetical protein